MPLEICLAKGKRMLIDEIDIPFINRYHWYAWKDPTNGVYYVNTSVRGGGKKTTFQLHRLIMNFPKGQIIDHIDGNGLNNTRDNLRIASPGQNTYNRKRSGRNTSGFRGVSWDSINKKWKATIAADRKSIFLGRFTHKEEAARAYDAKAIEIYGEFAKLNFPIGQDIRGDFLQGSR